MAPAKMKLYIEHVQTLINTYFGSNSYCWVNQNIFKLVQLRGSGGGEERDARP